MRFICLSPPQVKDKLVRLRSLNNFDQLLKTVPKYALFFNIEILFQSKFIEYYILYKISLVCDRNYKSSVFCNSPLMLTSHAAGTIPLQEENSIRNIKAAVADTKADFSLAGDSGQTRKFK